MTHQPRLACAGAAAIVCSLAMFGSAQASRTAERAQTRAEKAPISELWVDPGSARDLYHGPGGARLAPDPAVTYKVIGVKVGGFSDGYDVRDPSGRKWSAKFPPEASTEVVASRIHWGIGFHQPPIYFLREWQADEASAPNPQLPARFRESDPEFHGLDSEGNWAFDDNPFVGTRELKGLLVLQVMLGNSDLKPSNNTLYTLEEPAFGARRWWVVRDLGHTFGRTGLFGSPRGNVDVFEASGFVRSVVGDRVELVYAGRHSGLFTELTTADVVWICERLNRLSDRQWRDAFRAGGYEPQLADRFIRRMKSKVAEGLALAGDGRQSAAAR